MRILTFCFLFIVFNLCAQTDSAANKNNRFKDRFQSLQLTPEQEEKIKSAYLNRREFLEKRKEENRIFHESVEKKTQEDIQKILTPEQMEEYKKIREEERPGKKTLHRRYKVVK